MKRYISKTWIWIVAGLILTVIFVKISYLKRGYVAYGGEWLTLPMILMLVEAARDVYNTFLFLFEQEDKDED